MNCVIKQLLHNGKVYYPLHFTIYQSLNHRSGGPLIHTITQS